MNQKVVFFNNPVCQRFNSAAAAQSRATYISIATGGITIIFRCAAALMTPASAVRVSLFHRSKRSATPNQSRIACSRLLSTVRLARGFRPRCCATNRQSH